MAAPSQRLWERAARALGAPELVDDARFATVSDRTRHRHELETTITSITRGADVEEWIGRLTEAGVPAGKVLGLEEAVTSEVAAERDTFLASDDVPLVRLPWLADGGPVPWRRPAPRLGEHTVELLDELGFSATRIDQLLAEGAVATDTHSPAAPLAHH